MRVYALLSVHINHSATAEPTYSQFSVVSVSSSVPKQAMIQYPRRLVSAARARTQTQILASVSALPFHLPPRRSPSSRFCLRCIRTCSTTRVSSPPACSKRILRPALPPGCPGRVARASVAHPSSAMPTVAPQAHLQTSNVPQDALCTQDRKSTRLNSSHQCLSRMPSSA